MPTVRNQVRSPNQGASYGDVDTYDEPRIERTPVQHSTETRRSFATTEFWLTLASVAGILAAAYNDNAFDIDHGWTLATAIVIGYMVSRGIAKAGSRESYRRDS
ncbi:MAG TPA: hypothetical protein VEG38_07805 [Acidimicrobiia bacterium]|nr:hypothetical protein [Acidimicrobiia bacterium]